MGFLHQNKDCIFGFSIPVASFSYVDWIGANTVPRRKEVPTLRKFYLTVPCGTAWNLVECMRVLRGGLSAPKQGLHFWVLHSRSFLFICRLDWCKHGTSEKGSPDFRKNCTHGKLRRCIKPGSLLTRTARWAFCTKTRIAFLGSPFL